MCSIQSVWLARLDARQQLLQNLAQVAHERDVHFHVLVDLRRIDIDVNLLRVRRVGFQVTGHAVVEPHAEGQQQVGVLNRLVHPRLAVHAHHSEIQHVRSRKMPEAEQSHRHGDAGFLGERLDFVLRAGNRNPVPGEYHRPLRRAD